MLAAIGPWRLRSSGAHCDPELAKRIGEKLGEEDWRRGLAKRIGEILCEEDWRGGKGGEEGVGADGSDKI